MRQQRVLVAHNHYQIKGGEDTVVANEIQMLRENGHEVVVYTRHNDEIKKRSMFGKLTLPFETIFSLKTFREVRKIVRSESIDILHVHNTLPLVSPSVYYAAIFEKIPVVQTVHNFRLLCPGATFTRDGSVCEDCVTKGLHQSIKFKCYRGSFIQTFIVFMMMRFHRFIKTYEKINYIALTEFNKQKIKLLTHTDLKVFVKPNFMKATKNVERQIDDYFIFIGRIDELKGIRFLVKAWSKLPDEKLLIIGDGPLKTKIDEEIRTCNQGNIAFKGFLERDQALEYLEKARAIIVPSKWYEGFPMTIVEALSLGVPVIASDLGNLSSIVSHGKNGFLFKQECEDNLIDCIRQLSEEATVRRLSDYAYKDFTQNYTDKVNYSILSDIYDAVGGAK